MARKFEQCLQSPKITKPAILFAQIPRLGTQLDPRWIDKYVPELETVAQKNEFCEVYDEMVKHYQALCAVGNETDKTKLRQKAVYLLNRMFATEPLIAANGQIMVDFHFEEEFFVDSLVTTREYYQKLVALNAVSLVLAALGERKRSRGMRQTAVPPTASWHAVPQPLSSGMYQPPESAFMKRYAEETIRFPCTLNDLYQDTKGPGKRYSAVVAACRGRTDCTISLESAREFEDSIRATMDYRNPSIQSIVLFSMANFSVYLTIEYLQFFCFVDS